MNYVGCPNNCGAILTEQYKKRFGQCWSCYSREKFNLEQRMAAALYR